MELVKHIREWYETVPEECKGFITQQMTFKFPGIAQPLKELDTDGMELIIRKMELDALSINLGDVVSFIGCMDFILYQYDDINHFLEQIEFDKDTEAELIFRQSFKSAGHVRERIDKAPEELAARKITCESWQTLKEIFLNYDYLRRYNAFLFQQSFDRMNKGLWNDILKRYNKE